MKNIKKQLFLSLLTTAIFFISCNGKQSKSEIKISKMENTSQKHYCKVDSLTVDFLKKTSYKEAIEVCNLTIIDREFALKDIVAFGLRANLKNIFTKEELNSEIRLKEVTWEGKDADYITVWYRKIETSWQPIDHFKYGKDVRF